MILHAGWREKAVGLPNAFHHHRPEGPLLEPYFGTQRKGGTEGFGGIGKDGHIIEGEGRCCVEVEERKVDIKVMQCCRKCVEKNKERRLSCSV